MEKVTEDALFLRFKDQSNALIDAHRPTILKAFKNADDQKLSISLSIEVRPSKAAGVLDVEVGIGYVVERVKEKTVSRERWKDRTWTTRAGGRYFSFEESMTVTF